MKLAIILWSHSANSSGVDMSISKLSVVDGYYQNEEVRILFPKNAEEQREKFVKMGLEEDINRIVLGCAPLLSIIGSWEAK